jgi:hypothetical protein
VAPSEDNNFEQDSMSGRRVRQTVLDAAETIVSFAVSATKSLLRSKILLSGAFAVLLLLVAIPILFEADMPPVAADGTLKCYDGAGNHEPCVARATTPPSRSNGPTTAAVRPPSWMTTALFQQSSWAATAGDQQASWATSEGDRQASLATSEDDRQESLTTAEADQPANSTSAPAARRSVKWGRRQAMAACRRHLIPCFFSTLRKGLTRIAYVAASMARPPREHL